MKNRIISIGYISNKRCYLNIDDDEAIERYCKSENITFEEFKNDNIPINTVVFDDEFGAYSVHDLY
jgi:hypothetical protein